MGESADAPCSGTDEPVHEVHISGAFVLQETEVTREDFEKVMGYIPPSKETCPTCPVASVTWHEAVAYCNALSSKAQLGLCYTCTGSGSSVTCVPKASLSTCLGFRLPTEAEWEYAARAGSTESTYVGKVTQCQKADKVIDPIAWYAANSGGKAHPVRSLKANAWGLFDMLGNLNEWTQDWYRGDPSVDFSKDPRGPEVGSAKVIRGGSWHQFPKDVRAAGRYGFSPVARSKELGFRCLRRSPSS